MTTEHDPDCDCEDCDERRGEVMYFLEPAVDPLVAYEDDPETDEVHQPYTAFNQGYEAGEAGIEVSLNPYPEGTREWRWWEDGHFHGSKS
jgi:hypothetical protein